MLPAAVARSSSDENAIHYVLPVLWMSSCFHTMGPVGQNQTRHLSSSFPDCSTGGEVWCRRLPFLYLVDQWTEWVRWLPVLFPAVIAVQTYREAVYQSWCSCNSYCHRWCRPILSTGPDLGIFRLLYRAAGNFGPLFFWKAFGVFFA